MVPSFQDQARGVVAINIRTVDEWNHPPLSHEGQEKRSHGW